MPAIKTGEGYAKDAASLQRIIRRLTDDEDPEFAERNIERLQAVVSDFNDHSRKRVKSRPTDASPPDKGTPARKPRNGTKSAEA